MNIEELPKNLEDTVRDMQRNLPLAQSHISVQHEAMEEDLKFTSAGLQWEGSNDDSNRSGDRPQLVSNQVLTICLRVVNALRKNPFGVQISTNNQDVTELIQSKIRQIEYESRASESYENAFECAVIGGIGYYYISTDYINDTDLEQKVCVESIIDPTSVYLDPYSEEVDGSDANWGFIVNYLDKNLAEEEHGKEVSSGTIAGVDIYKNFDVPSDSVTQLIYYYKEKKQKTRYWLTDGSWTDDKPEFEEMIEGKRKVTHDKVYCCEFIGNKFIQKTEIQSKWIPIIPVYGDRLRTYGSDLYWGGMTRRVKDTQRMINYYKSNEAEAVALVPKAPFIAAAGQIDEYKEIWKNANTEAYAVLPYDPIDINGTPVPPPQRAMNAANTAPIIQSRVQAQNDLALESGVFLNMLGGQETAGQSGKAMLLRDGQGEISNAQYLDNFKKSMNQAGRIMISLQKSVSDTMRKESFRKEDGEVFYEEVNLSEIIENVDDLDVSVSAGPAYQNARKEAVSTLSDLMAGNPMLSGSTMDLMVENMDFPGAKEMSTRLKKLLPPELQDQDPEGPDAQAMQALQAQKETMDQMEEQHKQQMSQAIQVIGELRNEIISSDKDNETKIKQTMIQEESDLTQTRIKAETDLLKAGIQEDTKLKKIELDGMKEMAKITENIIDKESDFVEVDYEGVPNPPTPGGDQF